MRPASVMSYRWSRTVNHPARLLVGILTVLVTLTVGPAAPVAAQVVDEQPQQQPQPGLGDELYPPTGYPTDVDNGIVPIGNYDIGCSNGGFIGDAGCVIFGSLTSFLFSLGAGFVAAAVWVLEAATGSSLEDALTGTATTIADLLDTQILGPISIAQLGLVVSALYMGWQFLRGRVGLGAGEYAITLVVLAVLIHVSSGPGFGAAVTATTKTAAGISTEIVLLTADTDRHGDVTGQVGAALLAGFVRDPYDVINWGRPLTGTECAAARNQALQTGPHGFDDSPRQLMQTAGCTAEAEFNRNATVGRLVGALLYFVVAVAALILLLVTALTIVVAKGMALFLIALLPVALYAGLFPGGGRTLLWHWVSALVRVVALVVAMGVFLALLIAGLTGLLALELGMWERFLLVVFFMAIMWVGRNRLVDISNRFADSTLSRLEGASIGGSHGATWIRPYQTGGLTGLGVAHSIKESTADIPRQPRIHGQTPAAAAVATWRKVRKVSA